ncbi:MAG: glycosyltransferase [Elusimicrobia bacterium]|nr:glycosyltransferase [Elusimicrobiota bacterium]
MTPPRLWVVCPCFHDAAAFARVRTEAAAALAGRFPDLRFVLIDDSAGQDPELAGLAALPGVRVLTPPYNHGHQGALVYGLRQLRAAVAPEDCVLTMDSDGEDRPEDAPALLAPLLAEPGRLHVVSLAQRTRRRESLPFKVLYAAFKAVFRLATGKVIRNGNFAAFRGWLLKDVIFHPHFDFAYASAFISLPLSTVMVPMPRGERYAGRSRMGTMALLTHGLRMLLPFSEPIATRGVTACAAGAAAGTLLSGGGAAAGSRTALAAGLALTLLCCHGLGVFALLFVAFAQSKSRTLRGLHDFKAAPEMTEVNR